MDKIKEFYTVSTPPLRIELFTTNDFSLKAFLYNLKIVFLFFLKYFQKELPTKHESDHDGFLNKALAIKYNQKKMKK